MRKYTLTGPDLYVIKQIRERMDRALTIDAYGFLPADESKWARNVCNNRELYAIITHVRNEAPLVVGTERIMRLALERHGQPGWRGKDNMQPEFSELPTIKL